MLTYCGVPCNTYRLFTCYNCLTKKLESIHFVSDEPLCNMLMRKVSDFKAFRWEDSKSLSVGKGIVVCDDLTNANW